MGRVSRYQRRLAKEQDAASVYRALARQRAGEEREILLALARAEERHAAHWAAKLHPSERAPRRPGVRARVLGWLARRLGPLVVLGLVQRAEAAGDYDRDPEATSAMAADEQAHALVVAGLAQRARARASGWFRAAVFGANDGLVSNFSLVLGMAGAGSSNQVILLAGLAGLLAGALSMAAGEYVSVRSQRELLEAASQELDGPALRALAEQEAQELGLVFRARGMAVDQAERHAAALRTGADDQPAGEDDADAAGTDVVGSAVGAAGFSFVAFATGAAIPILPFLVTSGTTAIVAAAVVVGVALFATGTTVGLLTGGPLVRRGLRQLGIGAAAAVVTYGLGRILGTTIT
ncbi:MAG TPA: VIT1/CCC1 family protein [Actinomycetota bacterium]|nr:VIT1/CCC1 family protein [Actinomycetota bacterium]